MELNENNLTIPNIVINAKQLTKWDKFIVYPQQVPEKGLLSCWNSSVTISTHKSEHLLPPLESRPKRIHAKGRHHIWAQLSCLEQTFILQKGNYVY